MKYTLATPVNVGGFDNPLQIDSFEVHSISLTFDPQSPVLSVVLEHKASGWKHNVVYRDSTAVEFWARTMEQQLDAVCRALVEKLAADARLPAGTLDETGQ